MPPPAAAWSRQHKSLPAPQQGHTAGGQAHVCVCVCSTDLWQSPCSTPLRGCSFYRFNGSVCLPTATDYIRQMQHQTEAGKTIVKGEFKADMKSAAKLKRSGVKL